MKGIAKSIARAMIQEFLKVQIAKTLAASGPAGLLAGAGFALFAGGFQHGTARVAGPAGAPRLAMVHGGETISSRGTPSGAQLGAGGGGGGAGLVVNMSLHVADLGPSERQRVISALSEEIRQATEPGRELASVLELAARRNSGRVV